MKPPITRYLASYLGDLAPSGVRYLSLLVVAGVVVSMGSVSRAAAECRTTLDDDQSIQTTTCDVTLTARLGSGSSDTITMTLEAPPALDGILLSPGDTITAQVIPLEGSVAITWSYKCEWQRKMGKSTTTFSQEVHDRVSVSAAAFAPSLTMRPLSESSYSTPPPPVAIITDLTGAQREVTATFAAELEWRSRSQNFTAQDECRQLHSSARRITSFSSSGVRPHDLFLLVLTITHRR